MQIKEARGLVIRYGILILLAFNNLYIFYLIFTPLTVYPVFWILNFLYGAQILIGNQIFFEGHYVELVGACIAGAAYYLLFILNLTTPMNIKKRIKSILFTSALFLILNILRISVFAILLEQGYEYFDVTHMWTWYIGGTVLVVAVWFLNVYLFKINAIPVYTDIKEIFSDVRKKGKRY